MSGRLWSHRSLWDIAYRDMKTLDQLFLVSGRDPADLLLAALLDLASRWQAWPHCGPGTDRSAPTALAGLAKRSPLDISGADARG
jgi:hypothetical protein